MQIRTATLADVPALVVLGTRFLAQAPLRVDVPGEVLARSTERVIEHGVVFVGEDRGVIVAMLAGVESSVWFDPETRIAIELAWWVEETHRGTLGSLRLVRAFEGWAAERGVHRIVFSDVVLPDGRAAGPLIERQGYQLVERAFLKVI